jgi:hypothetical protein
MDNPPTGDTVYFIGMLMIAVPIPFLVVINLAFDILKMHGASAWLKGNAFFSVCLLTAVGALLCLTRCEEDKKLKAERRFFELHRYDRRY